MKTYQHQFIDRETKQVVTETLKSDKLISKVYSSVRERTPALFNAVTSARMTDFLAYVNYDVPLSTKFTNPLTYAETLNINTDELIDPMETLNTARKMFERKIRFWETRPMTKDQFTVVSPADSKMLFGSFKTTHQLFIKDKFFSFDEIIGVNSKWLKTFINGDFAVCRLTPDKYHFNHTPVAGVVKDFYEIDGIYHSCNPTATVEVLTPNSKNKRYVTIIDTDVPNGTNIGIVAMIEVVAMMIGAVQQCYSKEKYQKPQEMKVGMFLEKGCVKSLFNPGSSTDILLFEKDKIEFCEDLRENIVRQDASSRFSQVCGKTIVETDLKVRSTIARKKDIK